MWYMDTRLFQSTENILYSSVLTEQKHMISIFQLSKLLTLVVWKTSPEKNPESLNHFVRMVFEDLRFKHVPTGQGL